MFTLSPQLLFLFEAIIFLTVVVLHLVKNNKTAVILYVVQTAVLALLLIASYLGAASPLLYVALAATIAIKLVITPYFFYLLIRKHQLTFLAGSYCSMPLTLVIIACLTALTRSTLFKELIVLNNVGQEFLLLPFAIILISLFLIINRKGIFSQMLGYLSLENGIISFALFAGLEQNPALQLGITVSILVWVIMATILASLIFRQFGSLDTSAMKRLID
ncbi:MAG: hypothetical protein AAB400_01415 [Patescibacteria group bacterium]